MQKEVVNHAESSGKHRFKECQKKQFIIGPKFYPCYCKNYCQEALTTAFKNFFFCVFGIKDLKRYVLDMSSHSNRIKSIYKPNKPCTKKIRLLPPPKK